jgi:hypothetical protein
MDTSELMLFGQFVGAWEFDGSLQRDDGTRAEFSGEWHFAWALDGLAIQDILICPSPADHRDGEPWLEYGTTIRFYDPVARRWEITWITPVQRAVRRLSGGAVGDGIVLEGSDADETRLRWSFNDITQSTFVWRGEVARDGDWRPREEMRLRRAD